MKKQETNSAMSATAHLAFTAAKERAHASVSVGAVIAARIYYEFMRDAVITWRAAHA